MPITGEIKVILVNLSDTPFEIKPDERIAQIVVAPARTRGVGGVRDALRYGPGAGGFGSTGR